MKSRRRLLVLLALLTAIGLLVSGASASTITGVTDHSFTVDGLACNTGYQVTVKHGSTSEKFSVTTASCPQPPPPPPPPPATPDTAVQSVVCATTLTNSCQDDPTQPNGGETVRVTYTITNADGAQYSNDGGASWQALGASPANAWVSASCDTQTFLVRATRSSDGAFDSTPASAPITVIPADGCAPPPPPPGTILEQKDWEDGLVNSQGFGNQCSPVVADTTTIHRGTVANVSTSADTGSRSGSFTLPAYTGGRTACEVLHARTPRRDTDEFYAQSFKFSDHAWEGLSLGQYNYQSICGSPFFISGSHYIGADRVEDKAHASVYALINSGFIEGAAGTGCGSIGAPYYSGQPRGAGFACRGLGAQCGPLYFLPQGTIDLNVWYEIITHIRWASDNTGVVEGWVKKKGDASFVKKFAVTGVPTLQWGQGWSFPANDGSTTNDKFGGYREPSGSSTTIGQDSFCVATTFDAARGCL